VTDVGQVDDGGFNQSAWEGAQLAAKELGAPTPKYLVPNGTQDYGPDIQTFADQGYNVIVTVGFNMADETGKAAVKYPNIKFIGVDEGQDPAAIKANLTGLVFHEEQSGFLAGVLAARLSKSGTVGVVLGFAVPAVVNFKDGYEAGAKYANPKINVISTYYPGGIDKAFTDPVWGAQTAGQEIDSGADVIFAAAGKTGNGALQEAAKRTTKDKPLYCIGVDADQWVTVPEAHPCLVSSAQKLIVPGLDKLIHQAADGSLKGGNFIGEVGLASFHDLASSVPDAVQKELTGLAADLASGKLQVTPVPTEAATMAATK
jgi:basic membrane protein A